MRTLSYTISDELGIHARPAGKLVKEAKSFGCNITIECKGESADAKKLFAVMGLGVKHGDQIVVSCDGDNEEEAVDALERFLKLNL